MGFSTTMHAMFDRIPKVLAEQAAEAADHAADHARTAAAASTGALAYLQHVAAEAARMAGDATETLVMQGMTLDEIAAGLNDHGLDDVTPEKLRRAHPQVVVAERHVAWMRRHAVGYLPMLHAVAAYVGDLWGGLLPGFRDEARDTARAIVQALRAARTTDPRELPVGVLMRFAPDRLDWLLHVDGQQALDDRAAQALDDLRDMARNYFGDAGKDVLAARDAHHGDRTPLPFPDNPTAALIETVQNPETDAVPLHGSVPVN